jgi:hypothetical protein
MPDKKISALFLEPMLFHHAENCQAEAVGRNGAPGLRIDTRPGDSALDQEAAGSASSGTSCSCGSFCADL